MRLSADERLHRQFCDRGRGARLLALAWTEPVGMRVSCAPDGPRATTLCEAANGAELARSAGATRCRFPPMADAFHIPGVF